MDEFEKRSRSADSEDRGESDNELARTSADVRRHDHETITAEEEAERLLAGQSDRSRGGLRTLFGSKTNEPRPTRRARRKARWQQDEDGGSGLLYKAEEGGRSSSAESGSSSGESGVRRSGEVGVKRKSKASRFGRLAALLAMIVVAFIGLLFGAYAASRSSGTSSESDAPAPKVLSNGTHDFAPTTILISLDGFRADFIYRGLTPTLSSFIKQGVSPKYMLPSFPSLTFPNHFTLVTGLYPESHGIVGNTFWDPNLQKEFWYTDPDRSMHPEYWTAEPIWLTAELQGIRSAVHMWPGSEAHIGSLEPAYVDKFNGHEKLGVKVNRILGWLDMPGPNDENADDAKPRPQLIAAYVPDVDSDGHLYGPNSTYIRSTIAEVDGMLGSLFTGLEERNLTNVVNVVIVSDHGMATTSNQRLIQLEDLVDPEIIEHIDGWPLYGLRPKDQSQTQLDLIYQQLLNKTLDPKFSGNFDVYLRDKNMPERYHFKNNDRIAPLWIVPRPGWAIVTKEEFNVANGLQEDKVYYPQGLHGYDHEHPLMRAIFIARGPAFPHPQGAVVEPFQNTEIYNIVCDSLGMTPHPNNGTIRLPFHTVGIHDLDSEQEMLEDYPDTGAVLLPPVLPGDIPVLTAPVPSDGPAMEDRPARLDDADGDGHDAGSDDGQDRTWREWINQKIDGVKTWVTGLLGGGSEEDDPDAANGKGT